MSDYLSAYPAGETRRRRFANLPVWAQEELNRLATAVMDRDNALAAGPDDSDTFACRPAGPPRPLGDRPRIKHYRSDGNRVDVEFRQDGDVEVTLAGGVCHVVMGGAANVVRVRLEPWDSVERQATRAEMVLRG